VSGVGASPSVDQIPEVVAMPFEARACHVFAVVAAKVEIFG
jgi:hypothetical protein